MEPRIIKNAKQHRQALQEIERLSATDPSARSPDGARLELFAKLVEDYEKERFPFAAPDPVSAILFRMEERGLRQKDLAPLFGGANRASEVLTGKRGLSVAMIRALHQALGIPAALLIQQPRAE